MLKKITYIVTLILFSALLISCSPGPVRFGSRETVIAPTGQVTTYHVSRKRIAQVQSGLKGSDLITSKISYAYAQDPILSPYHLNVATHRGIVSIQGTVPDTRTKGYAIKVARYTKGVLAVNDNELVVGK